MAQPQPCPDESQLRHLIEGGLPADDERALAAHVEVCPDCRRRLEALAGGVEGNEGGPVPAWSERSEALEGAMERLKAAPGDETRPAEGSTAGPFSLAFLSPSDNPRHLGRLAGYEVLEVIGRGGMGIVLKALDPRLNRIVAIKVLRPEFATSAAARKRFMREAQAAAAVTHEHVVTIHAVDEAGEVPFLVMEYVVGVSLEDRIQRAGQLPVEKILRIGMQAAAGLAAAHAQGLVHRDIKPANILLENGVERVKITDFGLARVVHEAQMTDTNVIAGTPQYMSPEQARGEPLDHRSDLFSLGCVLYAMCVGRSPFRAETPTGAIHRVCNDTPRPIREMNPDVPEWLVAIIDRLLAKKPEDRFQTAGEVAELLGKYLAHVQQPSRVELPRPTFATSPNSIGRDWGFAWKAAVVLACIGILALAVVQVPRWAGELSRGPDGPPTVMPPSSPPGPASGNGPAPPVPGKAVLELWAFKPFDTEAPQITIQSGGQTITHRNESASPVRKVVQLEPGVASVEFSLPKRGTVWRTGKIPVPADTVQSISCGWFDMASAPSPPERPCLAELLGHGGAIRAIAFRHHDKTLAAACEDGCVYLWECRGANWELARVFRGHEGPVTCVAFAPDDQLLVTGGNDKRLLLWDVRTDKQQGELQGHRSEIRSLAISPHGDRLFSLDDSGKVILWDLPNRTRLRDVNAVRKESFGVATEWRMALSPDGRTVVTCGPGECVRLWDAERFKPIRLLHGASRRVDNLAFFPDGKTLVAVDTAGAKSWDVDSGNLLWAEAVDGAFASILAVSPTGKTVAFGKSQRVRIYDVASRSIVAAFPVHWDRSESAAFCPSAPDLLATAGFDRAVRVWEVPKGPSPSPPRPRPRLLNAFLTWEFQFAVSPGYLAILDGRGDAILSIRDARSFEVVAESTDLPEPKDAWNKVLCSLPDGRRFVTALRDSRLVLWDLDLDARQIKQQAARNIGSRDAHVSASADGRWIAATEATRIALFDGKNLEPLGRLDIPEGMPTAVSFCPKRPLLAVGTATGHLCLWDVAAKKLQSNSSTGKSRLLGLAFSPDGKTLVTTGADSAVRLWDVTNAESPAPGRTLPGHTGAVFSADFSTDGKWLVTGGGSFDFADPLAVWELLKPGEVKIWDVAACRVVAEVEAGNCAFDARFSPDGNRLMVQADTKVYVWDIAEVLKAAGNPGK